MKNEKALVYHEGDATIIGDLHGNIHDLARILMLNGLPPSTHYIFIGDYVDRGSYSVEVVSLVMALSILFPDCVTAIRGNHEVSSVNAFYGFHDTVMAIYDDEELYEAFNSAFQYMPLACILNHSLFCVHGGLSPKLQKAEDLESIQMPITEINDMMNDLLWSDPTENKSCIYMDNKRGQGHLFGSTATKALLHNSHLTKVIRGHESTPDGVEKSQKGRVYTVFSSSCYENPTDLCGFLNVQDSALIPGRLVPVKFIQRQNATFRDISDEEFAVTRARINSFKPVRLPKRSITYQQHINSTLCMNKRRSSLATIAFQNRTIQNEITQPLPTFYEV